MIGNPQALIYPSPVMSCQPVVRKCFMSPLPAAMLYALPALPSSILMVFSSGTIADAPNDDFRFPVSWEPFDLV